MSVEFAIVILLPFLTLEIAKAPPPMIATQVTAGFYLSVDCILLAVILAFISNAVCPNLLQEAQLPQTRDSASAKHVFLGSLTDRTLH